MPRHVRKGDSVIVLKGQWKGRTGEVLRVIPAADRVVVQGVNMRTKHLRPTQAAPQGGVIQREEPIHISNVAPVVDGKATRVRFEKKADGSKVRIAVRNGAQLGVVHGPRDRSAEPAAPKAPAAAKKSTRKKAAKKTTTKAGGAKKKAATSRGAKKSSTASKAKSTRRAGRSGSES